MKNHTYYFFNDTINIKGFDTDNIRINEKSYKNYLNRKYDLFQVK